MSICFKHEWYNSEGKLRAIPHKNTSNISFLRLCMLLKKMGIANYAFPLTLYDPDLINVNVHNLVENTPENEHIRTKVQIEARINVWYYLRECIRVYDQGGEPVSFRLDRGSTAMTWCFINGIDYTSMQPRQTGKMAPLDSAIKIPGGWSTMGDMKLGTVVSTPDGGSTRVIGVYPQGYQNIYKVTFEDGRSTECGDEHLWKVHWPHWGEKDGGLWRVLTLKDIRLHMETHPQSKNRLSVPLIEHEIIGDVDLPLDPYILGVILGDGTIGQNTITISKPDKFIKEEIDRLLPPHSKTSKWYGDGMSYGIVKDNEYYKQNKLNLNKSEFMNIIKDLGLHGTISHTKFIPEVYMHSSYTQKLALLQGLMDTDGTVESSRFCKDGITRKHGSMEYSTTSPQLAKQVQDLIRSIGGLCKITKRQTYYTHNGVKTPGKISYRVSPRVKDRSLLFRLPRKKDLTTIGDYKYQDTLKLSIRSIEYIGKKEAQCIEVDHPDHLYITDEYIVTHNTVCALSLLSWIMYSSGLEFSINGLAKDNNLRQENVKRVKSFGENLPPWWMAEDKHKDKKNAEELYYSAFKTHYVTYVAQVDKAAADKQGRGASAPVVHIDEAEYCNNIGITYPTMLASTGTARENAKKNNKPHSNLITTTAGDPTKPECREFAKILDGAMSFTELLYDVENSTKLHEIVEAASPQKMMLGVFSHLQLGYDNKWLRDKITRYRMSRDQVLRDFLNRRVSIQEEPVIPKDTLSIINSSQRDPSHIQMLSSKFVIYWYLDKETVESQAFKNRPIIVGCDSSEMIGRDSTTLVGIDPRDLSVVFTFKCNEGNLNITGVMIAQLLLMFPKMILVPENKSTGTSFIDSISLILRKNGHNPFTRIFNWVVNNRNEKEFSSINIKDTSLLDTAVKKYFGIKTDKSKRDELYSSTLLDAARISATKVRDGNLIRELNSLTVRNGRVDHSSGGHDDTVVAWLMGMWFILNAKHLDVYGIEPNQAMSLVNTNISDKNKIESARQEQIKLKIEELEDSLTYQRDPSLRKLVEHDIEVMKSMVDTGALLTPLNADQLNRDPKRYTDLKTAAESKTVVNKDDVEKSLRLLLGVN